MRRPAASAALAAAIADAASPPTPFFGLPVALASELDVLRGGVAARPVAAAAAAPAPACFEPSGAAAAAASTVLLEWADGCPTSGCAPPVAPSMLEPRFRVVVDSSALRGVADAAGDTSVPAR